MWLNENSNYNLKQSPDRDRSENGSHILIEIVNVLHKNSEIPATISQRGKSSTISNSKLLFQKNEKLQFISQGCVMKQVVLWSKLAALPSFLLPTQISHPSLSCSLTTYTLPPRQVLYSCMNTSAISYLRGHLQVDRYVHFLVVALFVNINMNLSLSSLLLLLLIHVPMLCP